MIDEDIKNGKSLKFDVSKVLAAELTSFHQQFNIPRDEVCVFSKKNQI